jgi:hypothetical protein
MKYQKKNKRQNIFKKIKKQIFHANMQTNDGFYREFDSLSDEMLLRIIEKCILFRKPNLEVKSLSI